MNIRSVIRNAGSIQLDKVRSIHETESGMIFGCKAVEYSCPNKQPNSHIKRAGLCLNCPRFSIIKEA